MDLAVTIAIYIFIWWLVLFAVLPFGVRTQDEEGSVVPGTPGSAPARPKLLRIFLVNTAVATAIFAVVYYVLANKLFSPEMLSLP